MSHFLSKFQVYHPANPPYCNKILSGIIFFLLVLQTAIVSAQNTPLDIHIEKVAFQKTVNSILKDKDGFLWLGTDEGLYRYDGADFELINSIPAQGLRLSHPTVTCLLEDEKGNLWIGTKNGVSVYDAGRNAIHSFLEFTSNSPLPNNDITVLTRVGKEVWIGNRNGTLYRVPETSQEKLLKGDTTKVGYAAHPISPDRAFRNITTNAGKQTWAILQDSSIVLIDQAGAVVKKVKHDFQPQSLLFDSHNNELLFTNFYGLFTITPTLEDIRLKHRLQEDDQLLQRNRWVNFVPGDTQHAWLCGNLRFDNKDNFLGYYDITGNQLTSFAATLADEINQREPSYLYTAYPDDEGGLWLGFSNGLYYVTFKNKYFQALPIPQSTVSGNPSFRVRKILPLPGERLLIGSYHGCYLFDINKQAYEKIVFWNSLEERWVNPLAYDMILTEDTVLMATEGNGLLSFDLNTQQLTPLISKEKYVQFSHRMKSSQWAISILKDHRNKLWLGTYGGLFQVNEKDTLSPLKIDDKDFLNRKKVYDIQEDKQHCLWVGTATGLYSIGENRDQYQAHQVSRINQLSITAIMPDEFHLWLGTWGEGFKFFDPVTQQVRTYTTKDGLASNFVHAIFKAKDDVLWISTENGLSQFDLQHNTFKNYYAKDGLPGNTFNHKALGYDGKMTLYLGGKKGIVAFIPEKVGKRTQHSIVKISRIEQYVGKENRLQSYVFNAHLQQSITLNYRDKFLSVYFSTHDLLSQPPLAYQLEGFHNEWQFLGKKKNIQFASLPPGDYNLKVKTLDGNDLDGAEPLSIPIIVAKAPYATWWAYLLYILGIGCILFTGFRMYINRVKAQRQWQMEREHAVKLTELNQARTRFFSNLAHELRTPLTLIKGPVGMIQHQINDPEIKQLTAQVGHHADRMLDLVDQILELGRIEAGEEKTTFVHADIIRLLSSSVNTFQPLALQQEIELGFSTDVQEFYMDFDPDKLRKVIYNVLSNACKFTPQGGSIVCSVNTHTDNDGKIAIAFADTGIGIAPEILPSIFDRFFQADDSSTRAYGGSGIGLAYVKELLALHGGKVSAESQPGKGTTFTIFLPTVQKGTMKERVVTKGEEARRPVQAYSTEYGQVENTKDRPLILIIEDHVEVANFIGHCLGTYQVICAYDGEAGLQQAVQHVPDLIITDLMMPKIDGITLAHQLKNHALTRHIPLIMLTAKANNEERLEGLKGGADAYLTKPFDPEELQIRVHNLLHLRDEISTRFQLSSKASVGPAEDPFVRDIIRVIEDHLDNPGLDVQTLVKKTATSRTQLHRKLKATTGHSAAQLIRNTRLEKAKALLLKNGQTVAQIAYQVGFSSPSHFTQSFRQYFGYPPSELKN